MPSASTVIGRYQVVDRLGQGGMGTVYLARDPGLDRLVAIKVLRGDFDDEDLRERFAREARSISRLRHPNIVTIFEYGDHNGQPYIVMEYISGESMAEMIGRRVDMTVARKLQLIEELCAGMAYAHRAKIVHRDIKPANIMLDEDSGSVKILDFGIARDLDSSMTRFTQVVGTPSYMSPEQASGQPLDHRSDIFSIGSVFYELLAHRQAFEGKSQLDVMDKIARGEPAPLSEASPGINPAIVSIVERALQKDPANRYQDLEAMRADVFRAHESGTSNSEATVVMLSPKVAPATTPQPPNQLEKRRASQIKVHLDGAAAALQSGDSDAAIESCEQVLLLDATNARALQLLDSARAAQQRRAIDDHIERARGYLDRGALTDAEDALAEALKLRAQDTAAVGLQRELQVARREQERARQRAAAAEQALERARVCVEEGAFESALRAASEVLAHAPESTQALALKDRALAGLQARRQAQEVDRRAAEAVQSAREQFARGDHLDAIARLESFEPSHPLPEEALRQLRNELEAIVAQQRAEEAERRERQIEEERLRRLEDDRQQRISSLVSRAGQLIESADYDAALAALSALERLEPAARELPRLRALATAGRAALEAAAEAEARRRRDIAASIETAATLLDQQQLDEALAHVDAALVLDPDEAAARTLRSRIQRALADRQEELERRALAVAEAEDARQRKLAEEARESARRAEEERVRRAEEERARREQQQKVEKALLQAKQDFEQGRYEAAQERVDDILRSAPDNAAALEVKTSISRTLERLADEARESARRAEEERVRRAEEERIRRVDEERIQRADAERARREEQQKVEKALQQAKEHLEQGRYEAAQERVDDILRSAPDNAAALEVKTSISRTLERLAEEARESARRAEEERVRRAEEERIRRVDEERIQRADAERARREEQQKVEKALQQAKEHLEQGRYEAAQERVDDILRSAPDNAAALEVKASISRTLERLAEEARESARRAEEERVRRAEEERARQEQSRQEVENARREAFDTAIKGARMALTQSRLSDVAHLLGEAVKLDPRHPDAIALRSQLRAAEKAARRAAAAAQKVADDRLAEQKAREQREQKALEARARLDAERSLAVQQAQPAEAHDATESQPRSVVAIEQETASKPFSGITVAAVALAVVAMVAGGVAWWRTKPTQSASRVENGGQVQPPAASTPAPTPTPAPPVARLPEAPSPSPQVPPSTSGPNEAPAISIPQRLRDQSRRSEGTQALAALTDGLKLKPDDAEFRQRMDEMLQNAETNAGRARDEALATGAANLASAEYDRAIGKLGEAARLRRSQKPEAIRAFWDATDLFGKARISAGSARVAPPAQAQPPAPPSTPPPSVQAIAPPTETISRPLAQPPAPAPQRPSDTIPPAAQPRAINTQEADKQAILQVLNQYVAAYNSLDAAAVARLVPSQSMSQLAQQFDALRTYNLRLTAVSITLEGDSATVTCIRQIAAVVKRGNQQNQVAPATTFKLRRSGSSWAIESVK